MNNVLPDPRISQVVGDKIHHRAWEAAIPPQAGKVEINGLQIIGVHDAELHDPPLFARSCRVPDWIEIAPAFCWRISR